MKPTTPQQIEATIALVRAAAEGDPLDDSHTLRGHLAMVLAALDEARREARDEGTQRRMAEAECDELCRQRRESSRAMRAIATAFGCEPDDPDDLAEAARMLVAERDEARAHAYAAERDAVEAEAKAAALTAERDEARAEQRDAEASRDLLVAGYTRAIREWLATHPGDSVPDVVDLFGAVMAERDEAGRAFRDVVAVLDRDGGQRQAGETIAGTLERAVRVAADAVVGADALRKERDEARAALASEPARIAAAEMARDVAWVRAIEACGGNSARYVQYVFNVPGYYDAARVQYAANHGDDIAAAIRAARGQS